MVGQNGNRTILSSSVSDEGSGPDMPVPGGLVVDPPHRRIVLAEVGKDALYAVDLVTGDRVVVSF